MSVLCRVLIADSGALYVVQAVASTMRRAARPPGCQRILLGQHILLDVQGAVLALDVAQ